MSINPEGKPLGLLLKFYDIELMEEFEITNMVDSPYHFNCVGTLCNCNNDIREEMLSILLTEPSRLRRSRKMWVPTIRSGLTIEILNNM